MASLTLQLFMFCFALSSVINTTLVSYSSVTCLHPPHSEGKKNVCSQTYYATYRIGSLHSSHYTKQAHEVIHLNSQGCTTL